MQNLNNIQLGIKMLGKYVVGITRFRSVVQLQSFKNRWNYI